MSRGRRSRGRGRGSGRSRGRGRGRSRGRGKDRGIEKNKYRHISHHLTLISLYHRACGHSFCNFHSRSRKPILPFYPTPVRVCDVCAAQIDAFKSSATRAHRSNRVALYLTNSLDRYEPPCMETMGSKVVRVAEGLVSISKSSIAFGSYPAKLFIELVSLLQRYGMSGIIGIAHSGEFTYALQQLQRMSGLEGRMVLSWHMLTACTYYKLALDRRMRGSEPEGEWMEHGGEGNVHTPSTSFIHTHTPHTNSHTGTSHTGTLHTSSTYIPTETLKEATRLAPLALFGVYESCLMTMQQYCETLGYRLLYANTDSGKEKPCFMVCVKGRSSGGGGGNGDEHDDLEVVLVIRGTHSIEDFITDLRADPAPYPLEPCVLEEHYRGEVGSEVIREYADVISGIRSSGSMGGSEKEWEWLDTSNPSTSPHTLTPHTYACTGMISAAKYLLKETGPDLAYLHGMGYRVKIIGHSLGGAVAALLVPMLIPFLSSPSTSNPAFTSHTTTFTPRIHGWGYSSPCCCDSHTSSTLKPHFTTVVLHDDVIARLTPSTLKTILSELYILKETCPDLLHQDIIDVKNRLWEMWRPRCRGLRRGGGISGLGWTPPPSSLPSTHALKELYLPGTIIHIYPYRGCPIATIVPKTFPPLRKIFLVENLFDDHKSENLFMALKECIAGRYYRSECWLGGGMGDRNHTSFPPPFIPHHSQSHCNLCLEPFTWQSTFTNIISQYRLTHNCHQCGQLVCQGCSSRVGYVGYGMLQQRRVCDKCFFAVDRAGVEVEGKR